nr:unnamed protein product [Spirometra erinaceieuropaei]
MPSESPADFASGREHGPGDASVTTEDASSSPSTTSGHRGGEGVGADDVDEFASLERQAGSYQAIFDVMRQTGQSSHDVVPDGKDVTRVPSHRLKTTASEEGVASIRFP